MHFKSILLVTAAILLEMSGDGSCGNSSHDYH